VWAGNVTKYEPQNNGLVKIKLEALHSRSEQVLELNRGFVIREIKKLDVLVLSDCRLVHPKSGKPVKNLKKFFENEEKQAVMDFLTLLPSIAFCYVEERANYKNNFKSVECIVDFSSKQSFAKNLEEFECQKDRDGMPGGFECYWCYKKIKGPRYEC